MKHFIINSIIFLLLLQSCEIDITNVTIPQNRINDTLEGTLPIKDYIKANINGKYKLSEGKEHFGDVIFLKWNGRYLTAFCKKNASFIVLEGGIRDSAIILVGYWRFSQGSDNGFVKLSIEKDNGARELIAGLKPRTLTISGEFETDATQKINLTYNDTLKSLDFLIIAHRGGGRNIDRHPASENTIEMLNYVERLGANGVELDVRITKDNIPVLFHDEYLNKRLIREDYFIGKVSDYTYQQLRAFCTLKRGEKIPALKDALQFIIYNTNLEFVWLDIKETGSVKQIAEIQKQYSDLAKSLGRKIEIFLGIADINIFNEFINLENYRDYPSICELDEDYVIKANSSFWGPRWSLGFLRERVTELQKLGKKALVWTLDEPQFIKNFLDKSYFNGILTNYPTVVAYEYYSN